MWVEKSVYRKMETGFVFKRHMNYFYVEAFKNQLFNQDATESAIFKKL